MSIERTKLDKTRAISQTEPAWSRFIGPCLRRCRWFVTAVLVMVLFGGCEGQCRLAGVDKSVAGPVLLEPEIGALPEHADQIFSDSETFYVTFTNPDLREGHTLVARMLAVEVQGIEAEQEFMRNEATISGTVNAGYFVFAKLPSGWPTGKYRIELLHDEVEFGRLEFEIIEPSADP